MKILKTVFKVLAVIIAIPVVYGVVAMALTWIPVNTVSPAQELPCAVFLNTNGLHVDIILPLEDIPPPLLAGLVETDGKKYLGFGWGDENFYINTPTWGDLSFRNAVGAMLLNSSTLMHVTGHTEPRSSWIEVPVSEAELASLTEYIAGSFTADDSRVKVLLAGKGYAASDNFYRAEGSYSCFKTCNTWVNTAFKRSGLRASLWTPFDFGVLRHYRGAKRP